WNDLIGITNNPWDLSRTPGGSTGGGAAALAAGLGFLELGSDSGGSICVPAHFCGVYGHRPTWGVVPTYGYIQRSGFRGTPLDEGNVVGPLARSAHDLQLELGNI